MKTKAKNERRKAASNAYYEQRNKRRAELESIESGRLFGGGIMYDAMKRAIEQAEEAAQSLIDKQAALLSGVAVALRGPEPPQTKWSHHDLPERVEMIMRDHICEECGETIPLEHPCNCQRCWNEQVGMYVDLRARLEVLADELAARQWPRTSDAGSASEQIADELRAELRKEAKPRLPTIEEMSGLVEDFTEGMSLKEYMEKLSNE